MNYDSCSKMTLMQLPFPVMNAPYAPVLGSKMFCDCVALDSTHEKMKIGEIKMPKSVYSKPKRFGLSCLFVCWFLYPFGYPASCEIVSENLGVFLM